MGAEEVGRMRFVEGCGWSGLMEWVGVGEWSSNRSGGVGWSGWLERIKFIEECRVKWGGKSWFKKLVNESWYKSWRRRKS